MVESVAKWHSPPQPGVISLCCYLIWLPGQTGTVIGIHHHPSSECILRCEFQINTIIEKETGWSGSCWKKLLLLRATALEVALNSIVVFCICTSEVFLMSLFLLELRKGCGFVVSPAKWDTQRGRNGLKLFYLPTSRPRPFEHKAWPSPLSAHCQLPYPGNTGKGLML